MSVSPLSPNPAKLMEQPEERFDFLEEPPVEVENAVGFEIEPNQIAEQYRNLKIDRSRCEIQKQLEVIEIFNDGPTILGSSNMTGRQWFGSLFLFESPDDMLDPINDSSKNATFNANKTKLNTQFNAGITDSKFVKKDLMLVGLDNGVMHIITLESFGLESKYLQSKCFTYIHDDYVTAIECFPNDNEKCITSSADKCINLLQVDHLIKCQTFQNAHSHIITSLATGNDGSNVFVSGSLDRTTLIWDKRQGKPAQLAFKSNVGVTSVALLNTHSHLLIGDQSGVVTTVDIRQSNQILGIKEIMGRPIHKIKVAPDRPNTFAVCGDDTNVKVYNCSKMDHPVLCYEDNRHSDFVRGLAWTSNALYSCSYDTHVYKHTAF